MTMPSRRDVLRTGLATSGLAAVAGPGSLLGAVPASGKKLLVLGGTAFLGPELVEAARAKGWAVTLFNRGKTNPQLFPDLEKLRGDRNGDLKALEGRKWDAVIDTSGYFPRQVRATAELLRENVRHYTFVSSISVYADTSKPGMDETAPVSRSADEKTDKITEESYGALKALCEEAAEKAMPGRTLNVRPGLIVGPGDRSDRFTYWPVRVARGGEVLAPGDPSDPVQFVDVRDLAEWIVRAVDANVAGVFNATGPREKLGIGGLLDSCKRVSGSDATFTWVPADFLEAQKVSPWSDLPVWLPPKGEMLGANQVSSAKAIGKGLTYRPLDVTVKETLAWWNAQPKERQAKMRAGLSPEKEAAALAAWKERAKAAPKAG
ncbi:MAG: NAD-dependent epimerase/dehydratase family protein [Acidobacteria bacterium]|nr:MAG: NAD-dependent epimerase/dehydratase family protein [Acidobacteriota bacterium]MCE7957277.1 NAD-dependent epimerase/dehydratase family protein [Acidobacteria bacterium ACB2]